MTTIIIEPRQNSHSNLQRQNTMFSCFISSMMKPDDSVWVGVFDRMIDEQ